MVTTYGTHITNFDANPPNTVNSRLHGGVVKGAVDVFELPVLANVADAHIVFKVPVDAILHSVKMAADDLGTTGDVHIGFYKKNADGTYVAVDADAIATAVDVNAAATGLTEYRFEQATINTAADAAYVLAGLSARPAYGDLYIGISASEATTAVGTVAMQIQYTE